MTIEENEQLIKTFPFLRCKDAFTGEFIYEDGKNESTWFDDVPEGWCELFIEMCKELKVEYDKLINAQKSTFEIVQVKEKYGELRVYLNGYTFEVMNIIDKYTDISSLTCIDCGKPAKWYTKGWIVPICDDCKNERPNLAYEPIDKK